MPDDKTITEAVKTKYDALARGKGRSCCGSEPCRPGADVVDTSRGYDASELAQVPEGARMGLGCGNPTARAEIHTGEVVVDLGCGAGIDCFLAAQKVGPQGRVIGVDMTESMLARARENARSGGYTNVEFRQGQIESLPVPSGSADLVVSNCVINLAPDKKPVFGEIFRVLRPGGRFCVSDVVARGQIPPDIRRNMELWAGCVAGALEKEEYLATARNAGFTDLVIKSEVDYDYQKTDAFSLASITLVGRKPTTASGTA